MFQRRQWEFSIIALLLPFVLFKGCKSYMEKLHEDYIRERTQESYVRNFLVENEAGALDLPKFKVNHSLFVPHNL